MSTNGPLVGFVKLGAVVALSPEGAWRRYRKRGAIDSKAFKAYYKGAGHMAHGARDDCARRKAQGARAAVCLELEEAHRLRRAVDPYKTVKGFKAPQSFRYLKAESRFFPSRPLTS